jgi:hypothetical protein
MRATDGRVRDTGAPVEYESTIGSSRGDRCFQNVKFPLWAPEGPMEGIGGISIDITDVVQAREEAEHARRETVARLARAVEYRDEETGAHIERMSAYCELIARRGLGLDEARCQEIHMASAMHALRRGCSSSPP